MADPAVTETRCNVAGCPDSGSPENLGLHSEVRGGPLVVSLCPYHRRELRAGAWYRIVPESATVVRLETVRAPSGPGFFYQWASASGSGAEEQPS